MIHRRIATRLRYQLVIAVGCTVAGCGGEASGTYPLTDPTAWTLVDASDDPYAAERPDPVICDPTGYGAEEYEGQEALSVETDVCNYFTGTQPALHAIAAGDTLRVRLFHDELTADMPAEAHTAVVIDGETVWEDTIAIPGEETVIDETWVAARDVDAGASIVFHLHNHGPNSWALLELSGTSE